ncbi:hypothetical protein GCM10009559_42840 [Pseudonocardia zijingensis]|uniref:Uncharacterized protein n=1 Tax=Pseudonocardia zijingensis TaxID=153376 RepID=A0ABN1QNH1_9PSEU
MRATLVPHSAPVQVSCAPAADAADGPCPSRAGLTEPSRASIAVAPGPERAVDVDRASH